MAAPSATPRTACGEGRSEAAVRARWESSLQLERESRIETGAAHGTAEVSEKKKKSCKKQTRAGFLFAARGTWGKLSIPLNPRPALAAGQEPCQQPGRLAAMGYESKLVAEELYPRPAPIASAPSPASRRGPGQIPAALRLLSGHCQFPRGTQRNGWHAASSAQGAGSFTSASPRRR